MDAGPQQEISRRTTLRALRTAGWLLLPTGLAVTVAGTAQRVLPPSESALVFILAVFLAAAWGGLWPGISTALLSSLAYDFFFIEPVLSLSVADPQEVFALLSFLCMAILTGSLAGRLRQETDNARRRAATLRSLYDVVGQLSGARSLEPLLEAAIGQIAVAADGAAVLLRPEGDALVIRASAPGPVALGTSDLEAARRAARDGISMPAVAPGWPGAQLEFRPLVVQGRSVAVIGFAPTSRTPAAWRDADQAFTALFRQIALASERIEAESEAARARTAADEERLRSALLSSVSHDLRTPLATILGSITSLRQLGAALPAADRDDLMAVIEEETERMTRFVADLLQMTRLEAKIGLRVDWVDLADVVRAAVKRAGTAFPGREVAMRLDAGAPAIQSDAGLLEQVLFNLIENALQYSSKDGSVEVAARQSAAALVLTVTDQGPGLKGSDLTQVFEKFYRGAEASRRPGGSGLGLAICRGIVAALGGTIVAESPVADGRGTRMRIELRLPARPALSGP